MWTWGGGVHLLQAWGWPHGVRLEVLPCMLSLLPTNSASLHPSLPPGLPGGHHLLPQLQINRLQPDGCLKLGGFFMLSGTSAGLSHSLQPTPSLWSWASSCLLLQGPCSSGVMLPSVLASKHAQVVLT